VTDPRTFTAAPPPASARSVLVIAAGAVAGFGGWLWWTTAGSGVEGLLLLVVALVVSPALWQLGMVPHAYSVGSRAVHVHRRWLPDSRFPIVGPTERFVPSARAAHGSSVADRLNADTFLIGAHRELTGRSERVFKAVTNIERAVRVSVPRGALLVSPEDPEAFVRAALAEGAA
jgi:hypothetical protein